MCLHAHVHVIDAAVGSSVLGIKVACERCGSSVWVVCGSVSGYGIGDAFILSVYVHDCVGA
jgi:hypothetical protein